MTKKAENKKCLIYARKSSESDERQVQSLNSQVEEMKDIARKKGLNVVEVFSESKSAMHPNNRPAFDQMIELIKEGEIDSVLTWAINRLARNPIESAKVQWLLQEEVISSITTQKRTYLSEDNALLFGVESSMANQFSRDLGKDVKRGQKNKLEKGHKPSIAPQGYMNSKTEVKGENYIMKDPDRFHLIRKAWDMLLSGSYTVSEIQEIMNEEWGYRTRKMNTRGGNPISLSTLYEIFKKPFYYGHFEYKGKLYEGAHEKMITVDEFDKAQLMLGSKGKPRQNRYEYAYTGNMTCGECGGTISATCKEKVLKSTGELKRYTFYYCVNAQKTDECSHTSYTNVEKINDQLEEEVENITILPEFEKWALKVLQENHEDEALEKQKILERQHKTLEENEEKIDRLTQLLLRETIDEDEYNREKKRLKTENVKVKEKIDELEDNVDDWRKETENAFRFVSKAQEAFQDGNKKTKRLIMSTICLNCTLLNGDIAIDSPEWLVKIKELYPDVHKKIQSFELDNQSEYKSREAFLADLNPLVRGRPDLNRRSHP